MCSKCDYQKTYDKYRFFSTCMLLKKNIYCYEGMVISKNKLTLDDCPLLKNVQ